MGNNNARHWMVASALLLLALAPATHVAGAAEQSAAPVKSLSPEQIDKLLAEGQRVLMQGIPDRAITEYFDPVIQSFAAARRDPKTLVYASHSMVESLMYSVMPAASKDKSMRGMKTVVVSGTWTDALELKAYALSELHRAEEAKSVLREATALSPFYALPWIELGSVYQAEKDWPATTDAYEHAEAAAQFLEDSGQKNKLLARELRGKGFVLTEQGKLDDSEALYKRCLEIDADDGVAKRELEYIAGLRKQRDLKPASELPATDTK